MNFSLFHVRRLPCLGLTAVCVLLVSPPARAEQRPIREDFRALAGPQVYAILVDVRSSSRLVLNEGDARRVADAVLADGKLDELEIDMIDELSATSVRAITIAPVEGDREPVVLGTISGAAARVFAELMDHHLLQFYDAEDPGQGWEALVRYSFTSETAYRRVREFLAPKALAVGKESTVENAYRPIREFISGLLARNNPLAERSPEHGDRGRWLIYSAVQMADTNLSGQLPDFLYSWVQPGGTLEPL